MIIKKGIKSTSLNKNNKVSKINIIIDYHVTSFSGLFINCVCINPSILKNFIEIILLM